MHVPSKLTMYRNTSTFYYKYLCNILIFNYTLCIKMLYIILYYYVNLKPRILKNIMSDNLNCLLLICITVYCRYILCAKHNVYIVLHRGIILENSNCTRQSRLGTLYTRIRLKTKSLRVSGLFKSFPLCNVIPYYTILLAVQVLGEFSETCPSPGMSNARE